MKEVLGLDKTMSNLYEGIDEAIELGVKYALEDIATYTIDLSTPTVDTGAYITSFSYGVGAGRPRGKSSEGRPKNQDEVSMATEGLNNLLNDINNIQDFNRKDSIILRNGSPHAKAVEEGGADWRLTQPYKIFSQVRDKYG